MSLELGDRYVVEYLRGQEWFLAGDYGFESDAVGKSRELWRQGVAGVRVLKISTVVHKSNVRAAGG